MASGGVSWTPFPKPQTKEQVLDETKRRFPLSGGGIGQAFAKQTKYQLTLIIKAFTLHFLLPDTAGPVSTINKRTQRGAGNAAGYPLACTS